MNQYINIFMQIWLGCMVEQNNNITPFRPMDHLDSSAVMDYRVLWDLQFDTPGWRYRITDGWDYKHACANHLLDTFEKTIFTPSIYSLAPLNPQ